MVFIQKAALRRVPDHAVVEAGSVERVDDALDKDQEGIQAYLDAGYRAFETHQPLLSEWISQEISERESDIAQSLGYFLTVTVFEAFRDAFPTRMFPVEEAELRLAADTLQADEELRAHDELASDDVLAIGQPSILAFMQHHLSEALEQLEDPSETDEIEHIYRALLVLVIALSHAIESPTGARGPDRTTLA